MLRFTLREKVFIFPIFSKAEVGILLRVFSNQLGIQNELHVDICI